MVEERFHVLISGGGLGGLCLAQGLKKRGVGFSVFERDASSSSRPQGYRIHISPIGSRSLAESLPADLFQLFTETCGQFGQGFSMVTEQLSELLSLTGSDRPPRSDSTEVHRSASRITLRRILLSGIEEHVHFGKRFARFEQHGSEVTAIFEDGSQAAGAVLVGADGVNSAVRKQYLPKADPVDTGVVAVGGKIPLTDGALALMPRQLLDGPVIVMPNEPCSLFLAMWKRGQEKTALLAPMLTPEDHAALAEGDEDYLIFGFGARDQFYRFPRDPAQLAGEELLKAVRSLMSCWHPDLRKLAELVDPSSIGTNRIRTSKPIEPWAPSSVTLLGDAIHSMTPYRGIGGNVALRDASLLATNLTSVANGEKPLIDAIGQYEAAMRGYGFDAVKSSLEMCDRVISEKTAAFAVMKGILKAINALPPLKQKMMARMGDA